VAWFWCSFAPISRRGVCSDGVKGTARSPALTWTAEAGELRVFLLGQGFFFSGEDLVMVDLMLF